MKYFVTSIILLFSTHSFAHCPYEIDTENENYCASIEWAKAEKKIKGTFKEVSEISPYLVSDKDLPPQWIFSKMKIKIWVSGDTSHEPVEIKNLKIFPYMTMTMGGHHSHSTVHNFSYQQGSHYNLSQVRFYEMEGCWSLRWSTDPNLDIDSMKSVSDSSTVLTNVTEYTNLSPDALFDVVNMCSICSTPTDPQEPPHSGHHKH